MYIDINEILSKTVTECQNLEQNIFSLTNELIDSYEGIAHCVQSNSLHSSIERIKENVREKSNILNRRLPMTTEFLKNQMIDYSKINEITRTSIDKLIQNIDTRLSKIVK